MLGGGGHSRLECGLSFSHDSLRWGGGGAGAAGGAGNVAGVSEAVLTFARGSFPQDKC